MGASDAVESFIRAWPDMKVHRLSLTCRLQPKGRALFWSVASQDAYVKTCNMLSPPSFCMSKMLPIVM